MFRSEYVFTFLLTFVTIVLTKDTSEVQNKVKTLLWSDCGGTNATVRWEDVQIHEPMRLKNLLVGAKYRILEEVKPGSTSKIEIWRLMKVLFVPVQIKIPCTHKFGSCEFDICKVVDKDNFCRFQRLHNTTCGCPMSPKLVEGYNYQVKVPEQKLSTIQSLFAEVNLS